MNQDQVIQRLINQAAEVITPEELQQRLASGDQLTHYIGFEISGYVHLGTGLMSSLVMKDLTDLGVKCTIWLADWHSAINQKLDGSKETAAKIGEGYFAEALKASFTAVGGNPDDLEIRLASDWYNKDQPAFWDTVVKVGQNTTLSRMLRSIDIMGRKEGAEVDYARTMYPAMQVADIFYQGIDIAHSGMDQRKAHVVMRDVAPKIQPDKPKPIAFHHPLLMGLQKPPTWPLPADVNEKDVIIDMKMSKSQGNSAVWVHDPPEDIQDKIKKAFCPEKETHYNPILNWAQNILFYNRTKPFIITRMPEHGGTIEFESFDQLEQAYASGDIHPMDLKAAVAEELIDLLQPVRDHFQKPDVAAKKHELDQLLAIK